VRACQSIPTLRASLTRLRPKLANHILHPVIFKTQIERIYAAGGRVFVEIGPRRVLTNLVIDILAGQPHVAIALNSSREKPSDRQLRDAVVQLKVAGVLLANVDPYELDYMAAAPAAPKATEGAPREKAAIVA
jgi:acyl transferase domain-containing protein